MQQIIGSYLPHERDGSLVVSVRDQTYDQFNSLFLQSVGSPVVLTAEGTIDTSTVTLSNATGFVDGVELVVVYPGLRTYFGAQVGAAVGNTITLDTPLDQTFPAGSVVVRQTRDMSVNGSVTQQIFSVGPVPAGVEVRIARVVGYIADAGDMDDSFFGAGPALTKGVVFRKRCADGCEYYNYFNARANGDFVLATQDGVEYKDKAGGGLNSIRFSIGISGRGNRGVAVRLQAGESLQTVIQDNLTGLEGFYMIAHGYAIAV